MSGVVFIIAGYSQFNLAIKPEYIVLAGMGGIVITLVIIIVAALCCMKRN
jgi:tRNA A22 N-methylase